MSSITQLKDLPSLLTGKLPQDERIKALNLELSALKPKARQAAIEQKVLEDKIKAIKAKLVYLPGNPRLAKEQEELVELKIQSDEIVMSIAEEMGRVRKELTDAIIKSEQDRMLKVARERALILVTSMLQLCEGPQAELDAALILSDIAKGEQRRSISKKRVHTAAINRTYRRIGNEDIGQTMQEIEDGSINQVESLRLQVEEITIRRMTIELAFNKISEGIPDDAPFQPKLLTDDDDAAEAKLDAWRQERNRKEAEKVNAVNDGHQDLASMQIYVPGTLAAL